MLKRVAELAKSTDLEPRDHFFARLVPRFGSWREVTREMDLATLVKFHQQLDIEAETERIVHRMNRPKTKGR